MPGPISFPVTPWVRAGIWAFTIGWAVGKELLDQLEEGVEGLEWRRLQVVFSQSGPAGAVDDKALCTFDLQNWTDGSVDSSWTTADYVTAEARFTTFFNVWSTGAISDYQITEYRWYKQIFSETPGKIALSGPPERITPKAISGAVGSNPQAHQVAFSVTEKTSWPGHWGRFYLPGDVNMAANGRWNTSRQGQLQTAAAALYSGLYDDDLVPVVPVRQANKVAESGLLTVTHIQTDDIPDVIRSRRPQTVMNRLVTPTT